MSGLLPLFSSIIQTVGGSCPQPQDTISSELLESAKAEGAAVLKRLRTGTNGLAVGRGPGPPETIWTKRDCQRKAQISFLMRLISNVKNPLVVLLLALGLISYLTGELRAP